MEGFVNFLHISEMYLISAGCLRARIWQHEKKQFTCYLDLMGIASKLFYAHSILAIIVRLVKPSFAYFPHSSLSCMALLLVQVRLFCHQLCPCIFTRIRIPFGAKSAFHIVGSHKFEYIHRALLTFVSDPSIS